MCVAVLFAEKLNHLMAREALSNLQLGKELGGVAHTTVARWREGARPRGAQARKLADRFKLPLEILFDDAKALPYDAYLATIKEGVALAEEKHPADTLAQRRFLDRHILDSNKRTAALLRGEAGNLETEAAKMRKIADNLDPEGAAPKVNIDAAFEKAAELARERRAENAPGKKAAS